MGFAVICAIIIIVSKTIFSEMHTVVCEFKFGAELAGAEMAPCRVVLDPEHGVPVSTVNDPNPDGWNWTEKVDSAPSVPVWNILPIASNTCTELVKCNYKSQRGCTDRGEICTTPNNEIAKCVPAKTCTILFDAIQQNKTGIIKFARQSQCGYDSEPLVCCGTTSSITLLNRAPDIDAFPNRTVCGLDAVGPRIYHGNTTNPKEFPWMAALEYEVNKTKMGIRCGGSVINKRYVLTAAHCIKTPPLKLISVWLGEWRISTDPDCEVYGTESICHDLVQKFNIEEEIPHPRYSAVNIQNDIALLRLAKDITYTDYIKPICLPNPRSAKPNILTRMTVAGWGRTENGTNSDIKLTVEITLQSNKACIDKFKKTLTPRQLCAGGEDSKDSCKGDSGGPLMRFYQDSRSPAPQWFQEGIVSWGGPCGFPGYPAVYTKVSEYVQWIVDIVSVPLVPIALQPKLSMNKDRGEICTTPNNEIAKCVPAKTCTTLFDAIKQNKTGIIEFARQSQCGYDSEPLVCCETTDTDAFPNRTVCGLDALGGTIIHEDQTHLKEFPWMAGLEYEVNETNLGIRCGGSVINKRYVLTAAHCIRPPPFELIRVWLGEWIFCTDPDYEIYGTKRICGDSVQKFNIEEKIPHPYFNRANSHNDIALLRLAKDIIYTDYIKPICLPGPESAKPNILTWMTVAGWWRTQDGTKSDIKLKIEIQLLSNKACMDKLNKTITSNQLCAGGAEVKNSCQGGGPLMRFYQDSRSPVPQWFQEGIGSWGAGCYDPDYPSVYTRVSEYLSWIVDIVSVRKR